MSRIQATEMSILSNIAGVVGGKEERLLEEQNREQKGKCGRESDDGKSCLILSTCFTGSTFSCSSLCYHHWWQLIKKSITQLLSFFSRQELTKMQLIQYVVAYVHGDVFGRLIVSLGPSHFHFISLQEEYTTLHFAALKQHADVLKSLLEEILLVLIY